MRTEIICIIVASLAWGGYPLIARSTGEGTPVGALVLTLSALIPISITTFLHGIAARPSGSVLGRLILAGMIMGIGTTAFNYVVNSRNIDASISIPIVDVLMLIVSVAAAIVFFSEPLTTKKLIGFALLVAGIIVIQLK